MLRVFRVSGSSMEPTLSDGDYVVAATRLWRPQIDKMVVVRHQEYGTLIKRIQDLSPTGYIITSDNPQGSDSRTLGEIQKEQVEPDIHNDLCDPDKGIFQRFVHQPDPGKRDGGKSIHSHDNCEPLYIFRMVSIAHPGAERSSSQHHEEDEKQRSEKQ